MPSAVTFLRQTALTTALCIGGSIAALGQATEKLTFEVASIKASEPVGDRIMIGTRGGPGTANPLQITSNNVTLKQMVMLAYDVQNFQVNGPDWIDRDRFDVVAKVREGATKEQARAMWQNLLAERFGVVIREEQKEFQVDELVVGSRGHKLKETDLAPDVIAAGPPANFGRGAPPPPVPGGMPQLSDLKTPTMMSMITMTPGSSTPTARTLAKAQPISQLTMMLTNQLRRPVIDKTGLTGKYDFTLEFTPDMENMRLRAMAAGVGVGAAPSPAAPPASAASEPGTNLISAIQDQLGLRIVKGRANLPNLIVEKANKTPTEN